MHSLTKKTTLSIIKKYIPNPRTIVEAGAFNGHDTQQLAAAFPDTRIHAFEPVPEIFDLLEKNTRHLPNVHCYPYALSSHTGNAPFFISETPSSPGKPFQAGSLLMPKERLLWSKIRYPKKIMVPTITLDDWAIEHKIASIELLWLDAQGHELDIVKASPTMLPGVTCIYTEVNFIHAYEQQPLFKEMVEWFLKKSFILAGKDFTDEKQWFFGNALFTRKKYYS